MLFVPQDSTFFVRVLGVFCLHGLVLGLLGVMFTSLVDLYQASRSCHKVVDEGPIRRPERGGSEWELIKILLKNMAYAPKSLSKNLAHTCQDHVVTTNLLTLGTS
jgi:hypothetical protein